MKKNNNISKESLSEIQAKIKEVMSKFEELRGFL
jgi:hypothetical protein